MAHRPRASTQTPGPLTSKPSPGLRPGARPWAPTRPRLSVSQGGPSRSQSAPHTRVLVCICRNVRQFSMITGTMHVCYHIQLSASDGLYFVNTSVFICYKTGKGALLLPSCMSVTGGGGGGTRPWWLALLACGGANWPLAFEPSASRHPYYCRHLHCRGHPPAWGGGGESRMQLLSMASCPDGLISAWYAVITKTPGWEVLTTTSNVTVTQGHGC